MLQTFSSHSLKYNSEKFGPWEIWTEQGNAQVPIIKITHSGKTIFKQCSIYDLRNFVQQTHFYFGRLFLSCADNTSIKVLKSYPGYFSFTLLSGASLDFWSTAQFQMLRLSLIDIF